MQEQTFTLEPTVATVAGVSPASNHLSQPQLAHDEPNVIFVCATEGCGSSNHWSIPQRPDEEPLRVCAVCGGEAFYCLPR
jgi:hypothetical protein